MDQKQISIREFIANFDAGKYDSKDTKVQCEAGWYDWFCKDSSLRNKTYNLVPKLKQLLDSPKVDQDKMYVFFKNNCPCDGGLYDDFRICDLQTGDVLYTVVPSRGFNTKLGQAEVWGWENDFEEPLVEGTWGEVRAFFAQK